MHKPESVLENETHKVLWDFEMQMDCPTPTRRPNLELINKKKRKEKWILTFQNERKRKDKYLDLWNMKVGVIAIIVGALGMVPKDLERKLEKSKTTHNKHC